MRPAEIGGRVILWVMSNPLASAAIGIGVRYAPIPTAKIMLEAVKLGIAITPHIGTFGRAAGAIIIADTPVIPMLARGGLYGAAAIAGYGIGAVAGTAISQTVWGNEGREDAIQFYTGKADLINYLPHYSAYRIVKHYATT